MDKGIIFLTVLSASFVFAISYENTDDDDIDIPPKRYDKYSVLRIVPSKEEHIKFLEGFYNEKEFDFWTDPRMIGKPVDIMIPPHKFQQFNQSLIANNIDFHPLTDDVQKLIDEENEFLNRPEPFRSKRTLLAFFDKYHKSKDIYKYLHDIASEFDSKIQVETSCKTYRKKKLKLIKLTSDPRANKPIIWIDAGIHAREWIAPSTAMFLIHKILSGYGLDDDVTKLLDAYDWYIMPLVNPDGYDYTFKYNRLWRKNRSRSQVHSGGVDLNRNFPFEWNGKLTKQSETLPNSETYIGPSAMSELETQAVVNTLSEVKNRVKLYMTFHSYGQYILFPWGYKLTVTKDHFELMTVAKRAAAAIKKLYGTEFEPGSISTLLYPATGNTVDWAYADLGVKYSYAIELRDKGMERFQLSTRQIIPVGEEIWEGILSIISDISSFYFIMNQKYIFIIILFLSAVADETLYDDEDEDDDDSFPDRYNGYSVLRIIPSTVQNLDLIRDIDDDELDFWTEPGLINKSVDVMVPPQKLQIIKDTLIQNNIEFFILIHDVQRMVEKEREELNNSETSSRRKRSLISFFDKYRTSVQIYEFLDELRSRYSELIKINDVGVTYRNRTLKLIQVKAMPRLRKPIIWIDGGIHAREWITPATATYFIYKLLTEYGTNKHITHLMKSYDWYIMPLVNPDGYDYTFRKKRFWRKNRSKSPLHKKGVDLNRNFPYEWNNSLIRPNARKPKSLDYIGPFPMSEIETQVIFNSLRNINSRVKLFLSLHSYGQYIIFPWGCKTENIKDYDGLKNMGEHAAEGIEELYGTEYKTNSLIKIVYPAPGNSIDWAYGHFGIKHSFVFELRDKGKRGFQLNKKYIIPVGEETWKGVQSLAYDILQE
ncbi:uncharacterized protein [Centruroides vittatus]|uniref:uncharacterized protein n=1 Tax=Centruroides vittatus TaxID=120091 RepID=UPI00350F51B4